MNLLRRTAYRLWLRGDTVECPICLSRFRSFLPFGDPVRLNALCPVCDSLERHRFLWLFLREFLKTPATVLGISPDPGIGRRLEAMRGVRYVSADVAARTTVRASVTALPFAGGAFDVVLCSHVLEHVPDDRTAITELLRVAAGTGAVLIMVPIHAAYERTFEDPSVTGAAERARIFGQHDHVRIYGRDFLERLAASGAAVTPVRASERHGAPEIRRFSLTPDDQIFICRWRGGS